jgi:hypothetical protein
LLLLLTQSPFKIPNESEGYAVLDY